MKVACRDRWISPSLSLSPSLLDSKKSHGRKRFDWFLQTSSLAFSFFFGGEGRAEGAAFASLFAFFLSFFFLFLFLLSPPGRPDRQQQQFANSSINFSILPLDDETNRHRVQWARNNITDAN